MITTVFIDIDDTLLDFSKCAEQSISECFKMRSIEMPEKTIAVFHEINDNLWQKVEKGEITRDRLFEIRFKTILERLGIDADSAGFEQSFISNLYGSCQTVDGAQDILKYLSQKYKVFAATNAMYRQQAARLKRAGLIKYLSGIFASEAVGAQKPSEKFFNHCIEHSGAKSPDECVMIGDSPSADIMGAKSVGMHTIHFC